MFDSLLRLLEDKECECIAYADDLMVIVQQEFELVGQEITDMVASWFEDNRLTLSENKTEMLLLKGAFSDRSSIVKIGGKTVRMMSHAKYLGVTFGARLNITKHIENVCTKSKVLFDLFGRIVRFTWSLRYATLGPYSVHAYLQLSVSLVASVDKRR